MKLCLDVGNDEYIPLYFTSLPPPQEAKKKTVWIGLRALFCKDVQRDIKVKKNMFNAPFQQCRTFSNPLQQCRTFSKNFPLFFHRTINCSGIKILFFVQQRRMDYQDKQRIGINVSKAKERCKPYLLRTLGAALFICFPLGHFGKKEGPTREYLSENKRCSHTVLIDLK